MLQPPKWAYIKPKAAFLRCILGVQSFFGLVASEGFVSSEGLCCPLLVALIHHHPPTHFPFMGAGMDIASYRQIKGVQRIPPALASLFSQFSSWNKADCAQLGLISLVADTHSSLARPAGNYCSIIIDSNQRWGLITPAVTGCSICLPLLGSLFSLI